MELKAQQTLTLLGSRASCDNGHGWTVLLCCVCPLLRVTVSSVLGQAKMPEVWPGLRGAAQGVPGKSLPVATLARLGEQSPSLLCTEVRGHTGLGTLSDPKGPVTVQLGVRA